MSKKYNMKHCLMCGKNHPLNTSCADYTDQITFSELQEKFTLDILKQCVESKELIIHSEKYGDKIVLVDAEDFQKVNKIKWHLRFDKNRNNEFYIISNSRDSITNKRTTTTLHKFIMNCPKGFVVDHINHDTFDNRKCNLRICTKTENNRNSFKRKDAKHSIYKGVKFHPTYKKFTAWITFDKKRIYIGSFDDDKDAALAYNKKAKELFGEFAYLNEIL